MIVGILIPAIIDIIDCSLEIYFSNATEISLNVWGFIDNIKTSELDIKFLYWSSISLSKTITLKWFFIFFQALLLELSLYER